jgi:thioredoxin 1
MKEISVKELQSKIDNNEPMLVSFSACWCGPCRVLAEEMKKMDSNLPLYKVDVEEDADFSRKHGVRAVPTIKVFKEGKVVNTTTGIKSQFELNKLLMESL